MVSENERASLATGPASRGTGPATGYYANNGSGLVSSSDTSGPRDHYMPTKRGGPAVAYISPIPVRHTLEEK
jgi:hypothetical protein